MKTENEHVKLFFAKKMKELRKEKKFSQKELGEKLGLSRQMISDYENGKKSPNIIMLKKLADVFEVSTDFLIGRVDYEDNAFARSVTEYIGLSEDTVKDLSDKREKYMDNKTDMFTKESLSVFYELVEKLMCVYSGECFLLQTAKYLRAEKTLSDGYMDLKNNIENFLKGDKSASDSRDAFLKKLSRKKTECKSAKEELLLAVNALMDFLVEIQNSENSVIYIGEEIEKNMTDLRRHKEKLTIPPKHS